MDPEQLKALFASLLAPITAQLDAVTTTVAGLKQTPAPVVVPPVVPPVVTPPSPADNALALEQKRLIEGLQTKVTEMAAANKTAEEKAQRAERSAAIDKVLGDYAFVAPTARATAAAQLDAAIKTTDAGALVAGDNLPLDAFAKDFLTVQHSYLLAPVNAGGSGAGNGQPGITRGGVQAQIEDIKPGMSAEARASVLAAIQAASPR